MSAELIGTILTAIGLFITLLGGMATIVAWLLKRMDKQDEKTGQEFKAVGTQFSQLRAELNDVNVAVARLEGPHQRLILPPQ